MLDALRPMGLNVLGVTNPTYCNAAILPGCGHEGSILPSLPGAHLALCLMPNDLTTRQPIMVGFCVLTFSRFPPPPPLPPPAHPPEAKIQILVFTRIERTISALLIAGVRGYRTYFRPVGRRGQYSISGINYIKLLINSRHARSIKCFNIEF